MKNLRSRYGFNKQERSGIFFLLLFICLLQLGYFLLSGRHPMRETPSLQVDSLAQAFTDSLRARTLRKDRQPVFPFNPNFITEYRAYQLGISPEELERLNTFRARNNYIQSAAEFGQVTGISDSLLQTLAPHFRFPRFPERKSASPGSGEKAGKRISSPREINSASASDLQKINGIGEVLSARILKFRKRLGGFMLNEQVYEVYGLDSVVAERLLREFQVLSPPEIIPIPLNEASAEELAELVYFSRELAFRIVEYRTRMGRIESFDELAGIEGFPKEKIQRITLYLSL